MRQIELTSTDSRIAASLDAIRAKKREINRRWRARNPERVHELNLIGVAKLRAKIRRLYDFYKTTAGCEHCGLQTSPNSLLYAYTKGNGVLSVSSCTSLAKFDRERAKCVIRCLNCHATRQTTQRR